jgi:N-acetylmuramoyl-L-alanine amidase
MTALRLAVLLLLALPVGGWAQAAPLRIAANGVTHELSATTERGHAYFSVTALEHLGGAVAADARAARVAIFGDTIVFSLLSPFFTHGRQVAQLAFPALGGEAGLRLPEQFFIEWLPARYPDRVAWVSGTLAAKQAAPAADATRERAAPASAAAQPARTSARVVVIDPGHGGRDPGKTGPTGLREKDAALAISNRLARLLRARGYEVHLTRTADTLIALADRPRMANRWKGERPALFLSVHANSVSSSRVQGFETFFLSDARTDDERRVAEMENAAIEFEDRPAGNGDTVEQILNDMRNDFYVRASSDLAEMVQDGLASFHTGPNRGVKRAGFRVLVGALMPAVLVEVAFISNPAEARLLGTAAFQDRVTRSLADAVDLFFERNQHLWAAGSE